MHRCAEPLLAPQAGSGRRHSAAARVCVAFRRPAAPCRLAGRTAHARCDAASPPAASGAPPPATSLAGLVLAAGAPPPAQWELDFCSRPLLDERGKKVWELLVTSPCGRLRYCEYFPNNKINSAELSRALSQLASAPGLAMPTQIRFFRAAMQTIIGRACAELGVPATPSRRCVRVQAWLAERLATVYPALPNFDADAAPLMGFEPGAPSALPDALRGETWAFVSLPLAAVMKEAERVTAGEAFGAVFDPAAAGAGALGPESQIPGVVVFSARADALAGWTNGLEIAALTPESRNATLLLESGVSQRWAYARWRKSPQATLEAEQWQAAKQGASGLHFLAVQTDAEAATCAGFWLMREFDAKGL